MRMTVTDRCIPQEEETARAHTRASPGRAIRGELPLSLKLRHGGDVAAILRYELVGRDDRPLLIVAGGISAGRHAVSSADFPETGWWEVQKSAFAADRYRILSIDWLGSDGALDLPIDPADQADAIAHLLIELGTARAAGFIGASYGGMVGMQLAARHPGCVGSLLAISASAHSHPYSSACRSLQRQALRLGENAGNAEAGVALARAMAMLTYRTPEEFGDRFRLPPKVEAGRVEVGADGYLAAQGARHCRRMSATAYRRLSESIDLHRVEPADLNVPLTLASVDHDSLVPAGDIDALAAAVPGARLNLVHSSYGHDAFLKEEHQIRAILTQFISSLERRQ